tara:strand:- start:162 stop:368 length:207 start_codon:yes stop_codon:yes gene_type:complete
MPVLIIGSRIYEKPPEEDQKAFTLVKRYRTDYFYECYECENVKGTKIVRGVINILIIRKNYSSSSVTK